MSLKLKSIFIYIYYLVLLLILVLRTSDAAPNTIVRLCYLSAFFLPFLFKYKTLFLPCLICFMTIGTYGFSYSYFPYVMGIYMIISIIYLLFTNQKLSDIKIPNLFLFIVVYVALINIVDSGKPQEIFYSIVTVFIGSYCATSRLSNMRLLMLISFTIISITLSLTYLINYEHFLEAYNANDGMERSGWTDPNYLSCIIGMGVISAMIILLKENRYSLISKSYFILVIVLSLLVQIMLASRGGLLCVLASLLILITLSNVKIQYKIFSAIILLAFLIWSYLNNYFELLAYRIANDSGGSGRLDIWTNKLTEFYNLKNPLKWLFGIGYDSAYGLASKSSGIGFHNDFIAVLCGYGLLGLIVLIYMMIVRPIFHSSKASKPIVISLVAYLVLACLTLEPISAGRLTYFGFWALIFFYSNE